MEDVRTDYAARTGARARAGTATLLGQVMFLVAVAIAFTVLGSYVGRDLALGSARICGFAGFGMLLVASFAGERFRVGTFAIGWLYATAFMIGLGLGPILAYLVSNDPSTITQAAGATALITLGMGSLGFMLSKDLAPWMRPLSFLVFGAVIVSFGLLLFSSGGNPIISIIIGGLSALLITVDFNYLRKHGTEADAVWLATGIFVSIINIFLSLLNLFGE
ncbi:MAG TPA: Bax inhibitor-1 family protein [Solirubrobacteraceae bacterium]|nr:Bax inhibitor-1 family protein [Solirubrobacteraceae bacterium]